VKEVTDDTFDREVLAAEGTVLVDFWAEWCPPCRVLSPILQQLADEHPDGFSVVKLNADDNPRTAIAYQAMSLPTMKVFRGGEVVKTLIGARPKAALERDLAEFLH
jgi:thioredoxin 1